MVMPTQIPQAALHLCLLSDQGVIISSCPLEYSEKTRMSCGWSLVFVYVLESSKGKLAPLAWPRPILSLWCPVV